MDRVLVFALAAVAAGAAQAQQAAPGDAQAKVPPVEYRSAFADYRPFREPEMEKWREVNDQVKGLGGHVGHVGKPKPAASKPAAGGHGERHK